MTALSDVLLACAQLLKTVLRENGNRWAAKLKLSHVRDAEKASIPLIKNSGRFRSQWGSSPAIACPSFAGLGID